MDIFNKYLVGTYDRHPGVSSRLIVYRKMLTTTRRKSLFEEFIHEDFNNGLMDNRTLDFHMSILAEADSASDGCLLNLRHCFKTPSRVGNIPSPPTLQWLLTRDCLVHIFTDTTPDVLAVTKKGRYMLDRLTVISERAIL